MNALTVKHIKHIGYQVRPAFLFHSATIAYIQTLFTPYSEALEPTQNITDIIALIKLLFPGEIGQNAVNAMLNVIQNYEVEEGIEINTDPRFVGLAKYSVIQNIVSQIIKLSGQFVQGINTIILLPWDIQRVIVNNEQLATLFSVVRGDKTLTVTIIISGQSFNHMLTEEFTIGLLLFSEIANVDFHITMFGFPLTRDDLVLEDGYLRTQKYMFNHENQGNFKVIVGDNQYTFNTVDFMQGFHTAAMWIGVDHHNYWSQLQTKLNETNIWTTITF